MKKKIVIAIIVIMITLFNTENVHATFLNNVISEGNNFQSQDSDTGLGSEISSFINDDIKSIISLVGNLVFAVATVILGAKYIWSGVEGKSKVKESLPVFVAAVIFFYLASTLTGFFSPKTTGSVGSEINGISNWSSLSGKIVGTVNQIVRYLAFAGILVIGLKYMFESSDGKAKIKERMVPMVLGMVLVFSASKVVDFIISVGEQTLKN